MFPESVKDQICELLMQGNSLRSICESNEGFPSESMVRKWAMDPNNPFSTQYARAREIQAERFADELIEIADGKDALKCVQVVGHGADEQIVMDAASTRLRLDARKWVISKVLPKKYGDKLDITSDGEKVGNDLSRFSLEQLGQLEAILNSQNKQESSD